MNEGRSNCPSCGAPVARRTLEKLGGVCKKCHKQPGGLQKEWIFFGILAVLSPVVAILMDQELAALESSGGTTRVHVILAVCYKIAGRTGVTAFLVVIGLIFATLAFKAFRKARLMKSQVAEIRSEHERLP